MKTATLLLAVLSATVYAQDKFAADKAHFNAFLNEVKGTGYQIGSVMDLIWPKLQSAVPISVRVPGVELFDAVTDDYMCATSTVIQPKIGDILDKKILRKNKDKVVVEVEAELILESKPMELELTQVLDGEKPSPKVPLSYRFKEPSKIKFLIEVQNFLHEENVMVPMCIMKIKRLAVESLSKPENLSKIVDDDMQKVEEHFQKHFTQDAKMLTTVGLVKATNDRLKNNPSFWVCSSKYLDDEDERLQHIWELSENFSKYCLKKKSFLH